MSDGLLDGLLVLDMSQFLSGPFAALRLGDLGARVIKIERPDGGDLCRRLYLTDTEIGGDFDALSRHQSRQARLRRRLQEPGRRRCGEKADRQGGRGHPEFPPRRHRAARPRLRIGESDQSGNRLRLHHRLWRRRCLGDAARARTCSRRPAPVPSRFVLELAGASSGGMGLSDDAARVNAAPERVGRGYPEQELTAALPKAVQVWSARLRRQSAPQAGVFHQVHRPCAGLPQGGKYNRRCCSNTATLSYDMMELRRLWDFNGDHRDRHDRPNAATTSRLSRTSGNASSPRYTIFRASRLHPHQRMRL